MPSKSFIISVLVFCLLIVTSCSMDNSEPLSKDKAIDIAAHNLIGQSFDIIPPSAVTFAEGKYTVVFTRLVPSSTSGETYMSRVVFDAKTQEALEVEINTGQVKANVTESSRIIDSDDLINRIWTPLVLQAFHHF